MESGYCVEQLFKDEIEISAGQPHRIPELEIKIEFHFAVNLAVKFKLPSD